MSLSSDYRPNLLVGVPAGLYAAKLIHQIYEGDASLRTKLNCLGYAVISAANLLDYQPVGAITFSLLACYNCGVEAVEAIRPFAVQAFEQINQQRA